MLTCSGYIQNPLFPEIEFKWALKNPIWCAFHNVSNRCTYMFDFWYSGLYGNALELARLQPRTDSEAGHVKCMICLIKAHLHWRWGCQSTGGHRGCIVVWKTSDFAHLMGPLPTVSTEESISTLLQELHQQPRCNLAINEWPKCYNPTIINQAVFINSLCFLLMQTYASHT